MGTGGIKIKFYSEHLNGREYLEDGRLILKSILKKQVMRMWTGLNWLIVFGLGPAAAFYEDASELSGFL
jgi:hypothetical protein